MSGEEPRGSGPVGNPWSTPFAIFGYALLVACSFALYEMAYYAGEPALASATIGTVGGIVVAVIAFFVIGLTGPPNE
jgi:hypothetical protein